MPIVFPLEENESHGISSQKIPYHNANLFPPLGKPASASPRSAGTASPACPEQSRSGCALFPTKAPTGPPSANPVPTSPFFFHPSLAVHSPFRIPRLGPQGFASAGLLLRYGSNNSHSSRCRSRNTHGRRDAEAVSGAGRRAH